MSVEFLDDDNADSVINISNTADWFSVKKDEVSNDPFAAGIDELKKVRGLGASFKRKVSREFSKSFSGVEGTGTQQNLLAQAISGYSMFDLVEPTYNLEYLSKVYEISTYNYAAINAKVANIVGLGYDFVETKKTNDAFDSITDDKSLERARRKLSKLRQDLHAWVDTTNEEDTFTQTLIKVYTDLEATGNGYIEIGRTTGGNIGYIGHIPSKTMRVRRLRDGFIQLLYGKAVFFNNFGDSETENPIAGQEDRPNEIIHLKKYTPMSNYYGLPDIVAAQVALAGNELSGRYNLDYFENKAVPRIYHYSKGSKAFSRIRKKIA